MKVILLQNVDNVGLPGSVANVKAGYFRNFLAPRGLALKASAANMKILEDKRSKLEKEADQISDEAKSLGDRIDGRTLEFEMKIGDNDRLFGSVSTADIAERLAEEGIEVERRRISIAHAIKDLGSHTAVVKLSAGVTATVNVIVKAEPRPEDEEAEREEAEREEAERAEGVDDIEAAAEGSSEGAKEESSETDGEESSESAEPDDAEADEKSEDS